MIGTEKILLLDSDPELGEDLSGEELRMATERAVVTVRRYGSGPWTVETDEFERVGSLGLLLLEGLLTRQVRVADYTCSEVLGPGDVLQPWLRIGPEQSVATEIDWEVVQPLEMAVLDRAFTLGVAPWPEIAGAVSRRLMLRSHWLAFHLAVCGLRRIEDRVLLVLWHFADRWGKVTPDGVRLDLRLTHDVIAAAIGARRPSVSVAVRNLSDQGLVQAQPRSRWVLLGRPPSELAALRRGGSVRESAHCNPSASA